jgi:hypothetical protein
MLPTPQIKQDQVLIAITRIRQEWQEAVGNPSLIAVEGNMGMLLADLINGIGLGPEEQIQILGNELFQELQDFLRSPVQL